MDAVHFMMAILDHPYRNLPFPFLGALSGYEEGLKEFWRVMAWGTSKPVTWSGVWLNGEVAGSSLESLYAAYCVRIGLGWMGEL